MHVYAFLARSLFRMGYSRTWSWSCPIGRRLVSILWRCLGQGIRRTRRDIETYWSSVSVEFWAEASCQHEWPHEQPWHDYKLLCGPESLVRGKKMHRTDLSSPSFLNLSFDNFTILLYFSKHSKPKAALAPGSLQCWPCFESGGANFSPSAAIFGSAWPQEIKKCLSAWSLQPGIHFQLFRRNRTKAR